MQTKVDERILRRPYTRTVHKEVRNVDILESSFVDVKVQWEELVNKNANADHNYQQQHQYHSCSEWELEAIDCGARLDMSKLSEIISQLKAIKSELLVHLNKKSNTNMHSSCDIKLNNTSEVCCNLREHYNKKQTKVSKMQISWQQEKDLCTRLLRCPNATNMLKHEEHVRSDRFVSHEHDIIAENVEDRLRSLAIRVWVWSICLSIISADIDLLSGSLSFTQELFDMGKYSNDNNISISIDNNNDYETISTQEMFKLLLPSEVIAEPYYNNVNVKAFDNETILTCEGITSPTSIDEKHNIAGKETDMMLNDRVFVKSCFLIYYIMTVDYAHASTELDAWLNNNEKSTTVYSVAHVKEYEKSNLKNYDKYSEQYFQHVYRSDLHKCILWLSNDQIEQVNELLWQRANTMTEKSMIINNINNDNNTDKDKVRYKEQIIMLLRNYQLLYFMLLLLVRLLSEHFVRRRWCELNYNNCFRPVLSLSSNNNTTSNNGGVAQCSSRTLYNVLFTSRYQEQQERQEQQISKICDYKTNEFDEILAPIFTLMEQFQLHYIQSYSAPWPIPHTMLQHLFASYTMLKGREEIDYKTEESISKKQISSSCKI